MQVSKNITHEPQYLLPGIHKGVIKNVEEVLFSHSVNKKNVMDKQLSIEWDLSGVIFVERFKLWSSDPSQRMYALKKLEGLYKALNTYLSYKENDNKIQLDASILIGKYCNITIEQFKYMSGDYSYFSKSYERIKEKEEDEIPDTDMLYYDDMELYDLQCERRNIK